jgi:membrane associated rhomboid family serine protease
VLALGLLLVAAVYFLFSLMSPLAGFIAAVVATFVLAAYLPVFADRIFSRRRPQGKRPKRKK